MSTIYQNKILEHKKHTKETIDKFLDGQEVLQLSAIVEPEKTATFKDRVRFSLVNEITRRYQYKLSVDELKTQLKNVEEMHSTLDKVNRELNQKVHTYAWIAGTTFVMWLVSLGALILR